MSTTQARRASKLKPTGTPTASKKIYNLSRRLMTAAMSGDALLAHDLLSRGANANFRNRAGESPLSSAAAWDQLSIAKLLIERGADPNLADRSGATPLMLAAQHGSPALVDELLRHGADPAARDSAGNSVLTHAGWRERSDDQSEVVRRAITGAGVRQSGSHQVVAGQPA